MGIYDRDYYRHQRPGFSLRAPHSIVVALIAANAAIWLIDGFFLPLINPNWRPGRLSDQMGVQGATLTHPLYWWQYVTYAFAHSPKFNHILFNMFGLFVLGRDVEDAFGRKEFLRLYLAMAIFAGVVWNVVQRLSGGGPGDIMYGASGAVAGVVVLFAMTFPQRTILLFFVLPIPAWLFGVLIVGLDMYGAMGQTGGSNVAYTAHLAGAAFAFVYVRQQWNLTRLTDRLPAWPRSWNKPKLRVHRPEEERHDLTEEEVDRILEKISREGEASLTAKERRTLEEASRKYQQRRGRE